MDSRAGRPLIRRCHSDGAAAAAAMSVGRTCSARLGSARPIKSLYLEQTELPLWSSL